MSHHVYTTRGIVLSHTPVREADVAVAVLTKDLGLVRATARGARRTNSKLSSALLPLSLVKISLVRGKHSWRITTVTLLRDSATELRDRRQALTAYARVLSLVKKLVRGEERNLELYDELEKATALVLGEVGDEDLDAWELLTVAKTLHHLGYLSKDALPTNIIEAREKRGAILTLVNAGIRESGLS